VQLLLSFCPSCPSSAQHNSACPDCPVNSSAAGTCHLTLCASSSSCHGGCHLYHCKLLLPCLYPSACPSSCLTSSIASTYYARYRARTAHFPRTHYTLRTALHAALPLLPLFAGAAPVSTTTPSGSSPGALACCCAYLPCLDMPHAPRYLDGGRTRTLRADARPP